jgi:hypothetical protein
MLGQLKRLQTNSQDRRGFMRKRKKGKRGRPKNKNHHDVYAEIKEARRQRRRVIKPGFWSNVETNLQVKAKLKKNKGLVSCIPDFLGKYYTHNDGYKGDGYRALVRITVKNLNNLVYEYGIDEVLAACEKSLNSYKDEKKKKILGDVVIHEVVSERLEGKEPYIACVIKTNKRHIPKFMGFKTVKDQNDKNTQKLVVY